MTMARGNDAARLPRARGVEQYPFDPLLRSESVEGLDRLRCISDRRYAATLYEIYILAERNEADVTRAEEQLADAAEKRERVREKLWRLACKARSGALGIEAQELAGYLLGDSDGADRATRDDDRALGELASALADLGVV